MSMVVVYRYPLPVRIFHWVNALAFVMLLMSGFQIFNEYPRLHWGYTGNVYLPAFFEIQVTGPDGERPSSLQLGGRTFDTTGVFGTTGRALPDWILLPYGNNPQHGRGWHFLMAWVLVINGTMYLLRAMRKRPFAQELLPGRRQLSMRAIRRELGLHLRLKHPSGPGSREYNLPQKLAYLGVIFVLLPLMLLSGLTMSASVVAALPWLMDLFSGYQSARAIHFITAMLLVLFLFVHVFQVLVGGVVNEMRSMITGRYVVEQEDVP